MVKDSNVLCVTFRGQNCSVDLRCDHCAFWSVDDWSLALTYIDELLRQREGKEGEEVKAFVFFPWF